MAISLKIFNHLGEEIKKEIKHLSWILHEEEDEKKGHFMLSEIHQQPKMSKILLMSLDTEQQPIVDKFIKAFEEAKKIVFVAAGSSYRSSLIGAYLLRKLGYEARAVIASEYDSMEIYDKDTLLVAVSQSGETMDVILALKALRNKVKDVFSIVNVPYSTIQRMSTVSLEIKAGPEKAVAATKTYINQVITFYYFAKQLGLDVDLKSIPDKIRYVIDKNEKSIENTFSSMLENEESVYIIGRGINYFASKEISLKLKEISYIHAEALAGGELKHGTLALIEDGTKVIALNPKFDELIKVNIEEIKSRGGIVIDIPNNFVFPDYDIDFPIYSVVVGQLLTYYTAKRKGLPIDKPRNLAKSITVI